MADDAKKALRNSMDRSAVRVLHAVVFVEIVLESRHAPLEGRIDVWLVVFMSLHQLNLALEMLTEVLVIDERCFADTGDDHPVRLRSLPQLQEILRVFDFIEYHLSQECSRLLLQIVVICF